MNGTICKKVTINVRHARSAEANSCQAAEPKKSRHRSAAGRTAQAILEALDRDDEALESEPEFGDFFWRGDDGEGRE